MTKYLFIIAFFVSCNLPQSGKQENVNFMNPTDSITQGILKNVNIGCAYHYSLPSTEVTLYNAHTRELEEIERIVSYSGLPQNFEIYTSDISNAFATIVNKKRLIIFNKNLLKNIDKTNETYWSSISILAHEIAHHLAGHTLTNDIDNFTAELEADKYSGYILYKLGASKVQAIVAIQTLGSKQKTRTHPDKTTRVKAIEDGWNEAAQQRYESAIPPPPEDLPEHAQIEYTKEMLWTEDDLNTRANYYTDYDYFEGIVTDIKKGDFIEVQVYLEKIGKEEYGYSITKGKKIWISLENTYEGQQMSNAAASWLLYAVEPGRRIKFAFITEGSGGYHTFSYIKAMPPNTNNMH